MCSTWLSTAAWKLPSMQELRTIFATITKDEWANIHTEVQNRSTAMAFLLGSDSTNMGSSFEDLENAYLQGHNNYPTTVSSVYTLLTNWKQDNRYDWKPPARDGVAFANDGKPTKEKRAGKAHITCHKCHNKGHYATECPKLASRPAVAPATTKTGATLLMDGVASGEFDDDCHFQFLQDANVGVTCKTGTEEHLPKTWILLDNQSTVDVFCNPNLLTSENLPIL